jgi:hypothetical protein
MSPFAVFEVGLPNRRQMRRQASLKKFSVHVRSGFHVVRFLIAILRAQRVGEQMTRLSLGGAIAARQRERFAGATLGLTRVAFCQPQLAALDPQQRIVRLDTQGTIQCRRGAVEIVA